MKITIYDVAKAMNLAPGTISKILHNNGNVSKKTRERVLEYVKEVGYVADSSARILKSKKSWTIGIVFSDIALFGLEHPFFSSVIQNFKNHVEKNGYEIIFIGSKLGSTETTYLEWCRSKKVDGVLIVTGNINSELIIELVNSDIPSVSTDLIMPNLNSVTSDDFKGIQLAVEYSLNLGLKRMACITGPLTSRAYFERLSAFQKLLADNQMEFDSRYVQEAEAYGFTSGYNAAKTLLDRVVTLPPEMIIVFSDEIAFGVIRALQDFGYAVPEQISVIGYDDVNFAKHFTPALTTIRQDKQLIGETAAKRLLKIIESGEKADPRVIRIPVSLVVRDSTKSPA